MLHCSSFLTEVHFLLTLHFVTCVCVCVSASVYTMHMGMQLCVCVYKPEANLKCCSSGELYLLFIYLFFDPGFLIGLEVGKAG